MKTKRSNALQAERRTPNAEHRTPNIEWGRVADTVNDAPEKAYGRQKYDLEERLLSFAASTIKLADSLPGTRAGNHIAGQLLRCGTSPLSNHGEAQAAESRNDFIDKLRDSIER